MKTSIILAGAAIILSGCIVTSVCPFYTQKDLVTEPAVLGSWTNPKNHGETWQFEQTTKFAYRLTLVEPSKTTVMETHSLKLGGQLFLDLFSLEQDYHVIPAHYLLKVDQTSPLLRLSELNEAWVKSFLTNKPTALPYHIIENPDNPSANRIVLTGDTSELQSFVLRHLKTPGAWKDAFELRREVQDIKTARAE
jgi:hypothetical protein